jgi:hypothetical protein
VIVLRTVRTTVAVGRKAEFYCKKREKEREMGMMKKRLHYIECGAMRRGRKGFTYTSRGGGDKKRMG